MTEQRVWNVLGILMLLVTVVVPTWLSLTLHESGSIPEKQIELDITGPSDFGVSVLQPDDFAPIIRFDEGEFQNVDYWTFRLRNIGSAPILPSDFVRPLEVSIEKPWKLVLVQNWFDSAGVDLAWTRTDATSAQAEPFLLNPGDRVMQIVIAATDSLDAEESDLAVNARIVNMGRFTPATSILDRVKIPIVSLTWLEAISLVVLASLFLLWYLALIDQCGIPRGRWTIVLLAALSYAAAEVVTFYVGGGPMHTQIFGRKPLAWQAHWQNWLVMLIHLGLSGYLFYRARWLGKDD